MRLSLKSILISLVGILMLALGIQGTLAVRSIGQVRTSTIDISENWLPSVRALGEIKYTMTRLRLLDSRYVIGREAQADLFKIGEERSKAVSTAMRTYEPLISSPEEKQLWDRIVETYTQYEQIRDGFPAAMRSADSTAPIALFDRSRPVFDALMKVVDQDFQLNITGAKTASAAAQVGYDEAVWLTIGVCGIALLIGLGGMLFVVRGVTRPLSQITGAMRAISGGDLTVAIPHAASRNEIGGMATSLAVFRDNLAETERMRERQITLERTAEEQRRLAMRQMADGFEQAVGGVIGMVTSAATELQATAQSMSGTATETASQSTTVAAAAEEAASNVNTVAAAAEELGASVQEIGRQVDGSAQLAQFAVVEAQQTAGLIQDLSTAVTKIGDVVAMISTIAAQTNLLALNATIEAARAGEAGRGFAVVAAEVKELASQTARATDEIGGQIGRIQGSTGQAVTAIGSIAARIQEISGVATSIAAAVEEQGAATQEIVRNVSQAAVGTEQVTVNISGVAGAAEETGAAASQVLASAGELAHQSAHLSAAVDRFLATVRAA